MFSVLRKLSYSDRLLRLNLPSAEKQRVRGDGLKLMVDEELLQGWC